jgi:hypothetical protein
MRTLSVISGIGLAILFLVGLSNPGGANWLTWLIGVSAVCSFIVAGARRGSSGATGAGLVSVGLFALWIIGMSTGTPSYENWWTFAFACVMAIAAISAANQRRNDRLVAGPTGTVDTPVNSDRDRFRRSA